MSRLYGSLEGQAKTKATRRGSKTIHCHVRGWDSGISVDGYVKDNKDHFDVFITSCSNGSNSSEYCFTIINGEVVIK